MNLNLVCYSLLLLTAVGSALLPYPLAMWFLLSSLLTWLIYGADKLAARKAWRRVPETTYSPASSAFAIKRKSSPSGGGFSSAWR